MLVVQETACVPVTVLSSSWFSTLYCSTRLPRPVIERIWDVFFLEGIPFLYAFGLAFLKTYKGLFSMTSHCFCITSHDCFNS